MFQRITRWANKSQRKYFYFYVFDWAPLKAMHLQQRPTNKWFFAIGKTVKIPLSSKCMYIKHLQLQPSARATFQCLINVCLQWQSLLCCELKQHKTNWLQTVVVQSMSRFQRFGTENAQRFTNTNDHAQTTEHMMWSVCALYTYIAWICVWNPKAMKNCALMA